LVDCCTTGINQVAPQQAKHPEHDTAIAKLWLQHLLEGHQLTLGLAAFSLNLCSKRRPMNSLRRLTFILTDTTLNIGLLMNVSATNIALKSYR